MLAPTVTGVIARYFGAPGGVTTRNYWIQAIYQDGSRSLFAGPFAVANTPASLGGSLNVQSGSPNIGTGNFVAIQWNPAPGAVAYDVVCTSTATYPTAQSNIGVAVGISQNSTYDVTGGAPGAAPYLTYTPVQKQMINVAVARFDFNVDGGLVSTLTPAITDQLPINAILIGATINTTVAVTSGGAATIAVGTTAGSSATSILAATGKASFVVATPVNGSVTLAAPVKMTAAGSINVTIAAAALTAGSFEVYVYYITPTA